MQWKKYNIGLVLFPVLIFSLGFVSLLSVSPTHAKQQFIYFLIGIGFYFVFANIGYKYILKFWKYIFFANVFVLFLTIFLGRIGGGSVRWLSVLGFTFQPSEFAKLSLILSLSAILSKKKDYVGSFKGLLHSFFIFFPFFFLVVIQPDLGTSLILAFIYVGIIFCFGINKYLFFSLLFIFGLALEPGWNLLKDYQRDRILVFLNPQLDTLGSGYNVAQALIAVGSGGLLGKGLGKGSQSHLQFLPAYWTDFVFASFAEEWGFLGVVLLLTFYTAFLTSILYILLKSSELSAQILLIGIFVIFFAQFFINIGMNMGIMPVTGIPLPFMTYGGSSLILHLILLGIAQNIWSHSKMNS
ncbi:FtsW/RodA/SpoVE family cell cycle protein [Patescibacteria group bacterium]|nr:FtsW/RodA/SpoVE family cell cycle protein [Patescibacteria group bacterium]